jgi:hypothetical protein
MTKRRAPRKPPARRAAASGAKRRARTRTAAARRAPSIAAAPVSAHDLRELRRQMKRRAASLRWNPNPDDVQRSVAQLVLTLVEFLRQLMERQAIRRMEARTLTRKEIDAVGAALMTLEETIREIGARFGLTPEDLNLDLGPLGTLM